MRIAFEKRNFCTDVMRRMEPGFAQNVRCHRGGGRFPMHSCNDDPALALHNGGQGFGATHGRFSRIMCVHENWIVDLDGRRKDNKIGGAGVVRMMVLVKTQTEPLQSICLHGAGFVGATNLVPKLEQKRGETAHPAASHTDKMNLMMLTREQFREVKLRDGLHGSYISPWLWP